MKPRYRVTKFTSDGFVMVSEYQVLRCKCAASYTKFLVTVEERVRHDRLWNSEGLLKPGDKFLLPLRPEVYDLIEPDFL